MNNILEFWAQHTPIFSILIPAVTAFLLLLLGNPGSGALAQDWRQPWRRGISYVSSLLGLSTAIIYLIFASSGQISTYNLGNGQHLWYCVGFRPAGPHACAHLCLGYANIMVCKP